MPASLALGTGCATVALEVVGGAFVVARVLKRWPARVGLAVVLVLSLAAEYVAYDAFVGFGAPVVQRWARLDYDNLQHPVGMHFFETVSPRLGYVRLRVVVIEKGFVEDPHPGFPPAWLFFSIRAEPVEDGTAIELHCRDVVGSCFVHGRDRVFFVERCGARITETDALFQDLWERREELADLGQLRLRAMTASYGPLGDSLLWKKLRQLDRSKMDATWRRFLELTGPE